MREWSGGLRGGRVAGRGVVSVELALVAPLLLLLLFGILEVGLLVGDAVVLNAAARAGARAAAVGATTAEVDARIASVAAGLSGADLTVTKQYRERSAEGWTPWVDLTDVPAEATVVNSAPSGAEIRISLSYRHALLLPGLFGGLADSPGGSVKTLNVSAYMQRE